MAHILALAHKDLYDIEAQLKNIAQRELSDGNQKDPINKLRLLCLSRGATGILEFGRAFRNMEYHGCTVLSREEFFKGIKDFGLDVSDDELNEMFNSFDEANNGSVNINEFLLRVRTPMSERRLEIIDQAFASMDKTSDGIITVEDVKKFYRVQDHPKYECGDMSKDEIQTQFLNHFDDTHGEKVDIITKEEFVNYYAAISASIDEDSYFDLMMRQAWKL